MSNPSAPFVKLEALDLGALLCSRVCHDVISPVGAITNGLEVLDDEDSTDMHEFAIDLIKKSAKQASSRLQFARLAFGAAGSAGSEIDTGDAENVARGMVDAEKTNLTWNIPRQYLAKNKVKLLLNLILIAISSIHRGGDINVDGEITPETAQFTVVAKGTNAKVQATTSDILNADEPPHAVDAHSIQPHYTKLVAEACNMAVTLATGEDEVTLKAASIEKA